MIASTSCLVTSTPDFTPPERTRPFLVASSADPDTRSVILIDTVEHPKSQTSLDFTVDVVSEDQGGKIEGVLYIDYGKVEGKTFLELIQISDVPPGTLSDPAPRKVRATWDVKNSVITEGCHSVTMLVSHDIDRFTSCPVCRNDSSQITWQVYSCGLAPAATCVADFSACQNVGPGCGISVDPDAGAACGALQ